MHAISLGLLDRDEKQLIWQGKVVQPWLGPQWMELIHCEDLSHVHRWLHARAGVLRCRLYYFRPPARGWIHLELRAIPIIPSASLISARPLCFEHTHE